jgi:hypothetical protein
MTRVLPTYGYRTNNKNNRPSNPDINLSAISIQFLSFTPRVEVISRNLLNDRNQPRSLLHWLC